MKPNTGIAIGAAAAAAALPFLLPVSFTLGTYQIEIHLHHGTIAALFVIMATGLNLSIGFAGLLDLGFIAFAAVGAYLMAIGLTAESPIPWWAVLPAAIVSATLLRCALGATCLRLRGDYLAIVTLGFGEITRVALKNNIFNATGGPNGIFIGSGMPALFTDSPLPLYYISTALAFSSCWTLYRWRTSRIGRSWEAIREDEIAAVSCGIDVFRARVTAYGLGGAFAGLAGGLYAINSLTAHPSDFQFFESVKVVSMVVLGGMGSIGGVVAGSVFFVLLLEIFRGLAEYRLLIFGAVLVLLMNWRPQGIAGRKR